MLEFVLTPVTPCSLKMSLTSEQRLRRRYLTSTQVTTWRESSICSHWTSDVSDEFQVLSYTQRLAPVCLSCDIHPGELLVALWNRHSSAWLLRYLFGFIPTRDLDVLHSCHKCPSQRDREITLDVAPPRASLTHITLFGVFLGVYESHYVEMVDRLDPAYS